MVAVALAAVDTCYTYQDAVVVASSFPAVDSCLAAFDMASVPAAVGGSDTSSVAVACTADLEELRLALVVASCLDAVVGIDPAVGSCRTLASGHCSNSCPVDQLVGFVPVAVEVASSSERKSTSKLVQNRYIQKTESLPDSVELVAACDLQLVTVG